MKITQILIDSIVIIIMGLLILFIAKVSSIPKISQTKTLISYRTDIRQYLSWSLGTDWKNLTNEQLIDAWNKKHHHKIKITDNFRSTLHIVYLSYINGDL